MEQKTIQAALQTVAALILVVGVTIMLIGQIRTERASRNLRKWADE